MKDLKITKNNYCKIFALTFSAMVTFLCQVNAKSIYVDEQVKDFPTISGKNSVVIQLVSHGRPGELLLDGKWRNAHQIASFIKVKHLLSDNSRSLNIYGCEFAKGEKGLHAMAILQKELGVAVAASTNVTGKHGDWNLEAGKPADVLNIADYPYDLQTICKDTTFTPVNTGWSSATTQPSYNPPTGCINNNGQTTNNDNGAYGWGFLTAYDSPNGYQWSRTLNGLNSGGTYRVRVKILSYTNGTDLRNSYFQNYNLAGQTGNFTAHGGSSIADQTSYNFLVSNQSSLSFSGTIVGAPWNACDQAVNYYVSILVDQVTVTTTYSSPTVTANNASNACPALTTNLTGLASGCGNGSAIEWHTSNTGYSNADKIPDITNVANGIYYAVCYNTAKSCYSAPSTGVTVANTSCAPLPIDFKNYNATWNKNDATITWTAANEDNNNYFSVERSFDGRNFSEVDQIKSIGNHKDDHVYTYTDINAKMLTTDKVFYRIRQIDIDGVSTTTNIITLAVNESKEIAYIYPNPVVGGNVNFVYQNNATNNALINIQLVDAYGRILYKAKQSVSNGKNQIVVPTSGIRTGIYFLKYSNAENNVDGVIRIVKN